MALKIGRTLADAIGEYNELVEAEGHLRNSGGIYSPSRTVIEAYDAVVLARKVLANEIRPHMTGPVAYMTTYFDVAGVTYYWDGPCNGPRSFSIEKVDAATITL